MAHTATFTQGHASFGARLTALFTRIKAARARATEYQRTYSELQRLTNRELDDIGVRRCDIADIAQKHAYCS